MFDEKLNSNRAIISLMISFIIMFSMNQVFAANVDVEQILGHWVAYEKTSGGGNYKTEITISQEVGQGEYIGEIFIVNVNDNSYARQTAKIYVSGLNVEIRGTVVESSTPWQADNYSLKWENGKLVGTAVDDNGVETLWVLFAKQ